MKMLLGFLFVILLSAESAHVMKETPEGRIARNKPYGTGYVLRTRCPVVPGTIHLTVGGLPYEEGKDFYAGDKDPNQNPSGLASNEIAALDFDLSKTKRRKAPSVEVDYQTPDADCAARK